MVQPFTSVDAPGNISAANKAPMVVPVLRQRASAHCTGNMQMSVPDPARMGYQCASELEVSSAALRQCISSC